MVKKQCPASIQFFGQIIQRFRVIRQNIHLEDFESEWVEENLNKEQK